MARKTSDKPRKPRKTKVPSADGDVDSGHNMKVNRKEAKALFDRLDAVHAEKASKNPMPAAPFSERAICRAVRRR
jgi:hypothetical protein